MAKYAYYDPQSFIVLDWMDTELYNYPERKYLIEVTGQQWQEYANTNNRTGLIVKHYHLSLLHHRNFYKLEKANGYLMKLRCVWFLAI